MLAATGAPPSKQDGPLLDFHRDLSKDLEASREANATPRPGNLKRAGTDDSVDEFVDAEG